jgi:hypothetical protein
VQQPVFSKKDSSSSRLDSKTKDGYIAREERERERD